MKNKLILFFFFTMAVCIGLLSFMVFALIEENKTLRLADKVKEERIIYLRKTLLSCGESVRQGNELLDGQTLIMKLNK
jgi:hypothetical protein